MQAWKKIRIVILASSCISIISLLGILQSGIDRFKPQNTEIFPKDLNFSKNWEFVGSSKIDLDTALQASDIQASRPGRRYQYLYLPDSDPCQIQEILSSSDDSKPCSGNYVNAEMIFFNQGTPVNSVEVLENILNVSVAEIEPNASIQSQVNVGFTMAFIHNNRSYLTSCINASGGTTVTRFQHIQNRNFHDVNPQRILTWIIGLNDLRDWRCLWTNLSAEIDATSNYTPSPLLHEFWQLWYAWWSNNFPEN